MPLGQPVEVVGVDPNVAVPVKILEDKTGKHPLPYQNQKFDPSLPAKTTFQEDLNFAGQRKVNLIWEYTQASVALAVVFITMIASVIGMYLDLMIPNLIAVAFGTVVGFYFSRTNHQAIGGMGPKANEMQEYKGR